MRNVNLEGAYELLKKYYRERNTKEGNYKKFVGAAMVYQTLTGMKHRQLSEQLERDCEAAA